MDSQRAKQSTTMLIINIYSIITYIFVLPKLLNSNAQCWQISNYKTPASSSNTSYSAAAVTAIVSNTGDY